MADRCPASITIGGTLPIFWQDTFADLVRDEGLALEWDDEEFDITQVPEDEPLRLMANDVAWGRFDELEAFCIEHHLPFARWSGACAGAWDADRTLFRGDGELQSYAATDSDHILIERQTIEALGSYAAIIAYFDAADFVIPPLTIIR